LHYPKRWDAQTLKGKLFELYEDAIRKYDANAVKTEEAMKELRGPYCHNENILSINFSNNKINAPIFSLCGFMMVAHSRSA